MHIRGKGGSPVRVAMPAKLGWAMVHTASGGVIQRVCL